MGISSVYSPIIIGRNSFSFFMQNRFTVTFPLLTRREIYVILEEDNQGEQHITVPLDYSLEEGRGRSIRR
jgi:hypothetical protein